MQDGCVAGSAATAGERLPLRDSPCASISLHSGKREMVGVEGGN